MKHLKNLLIVIVILLTIPCAAAAIQVELGWDANTDHTLGYRLFMRTASTYNYTLPIKQIAGREVVSAIVDLPDQPAGSLTTFYFVLRAYSAEGIESDNSNEVSYVVDLRKPAAPSGLWVKIWRAIIGLFGGSLKAKTI